MDGSTAAQEQVEAIVNGARLRLASYQEHAHVLSAVLRAVEQYDYLLGIMRSSETADEGRQRVANLMGLDSVQTSAVAGITMEMLTQRHHRRMVRDYHEALSRYRT